MTPRQLKYFIEIARARSFTRAAGVLHVAQPALSRQIQQLEDDVGVKLFRRTDAGVLLTDAGALLLERAPALLAQYRQVRDEVAGHASQPTGPLQLGMPPSLFDLLTGSLVTDCAQRFPQLELSVVEGVSAHLHDAVRGGQLDLAVVVAGEPLTKLSARMLVREPMLLLSEAGRGMGDAISLEDLQQLRLAGTQRPNAMRTILDDRLAAAGTDVQYVLQSNSSRLLTRVAQTGWARAVLPYSAAAELLSQGQLSANPVEGLDISWMFVSDRLRPSDSVASVQAMVCEQVRALVDSGGWPGAVLLM